MKLLFVLVFAVGCQVDSVVECSYSGHEEDPPYNELIWVCHNPDSENHGLRCTEECFDEGDTSSFCWILETDQCKHELNPQRLNEACGALNIR